jgi:putative endonuclease
VTKAPPGSQPSERARRGLLARLLGTRGERAAVRALKQRGYRVLGRNLRTPAGELDVLAEERGMLVLVEVKTCPAPDAAGVRPAPWDRIGPAGCRRLDGIGRWLTAQSAFRGRGYRADLVAVTLGPGRPLVTIRPDAL